MGSSFCPQDKRALFVLYNREGRIFENLVTPGTHRYFTLFFSRMRKYASNLTQIRIDHRAVVRLELFLVLFVFS